MRQFLMRNGKYSFNVSVNNDGLQYQKRLFLIREEFRNLLANKWQKAELKL